ncbi:hypothetical protein FJZ26_06185 [Candidatus Parvarchaeota archaeon]|nr:hypothetical protein [Candidatus Parvarchaeota archaeon]
MIKRPLGEKILELENGDLGRILEKTGAKESEIIYYANDKSLGKKQLLNAEPFLDIDTVLISSRHLYRMPYSFNEKSGLVSVTIDPAKVMSFSINEARHPVKVSQFRFLDSTKAVKGEASKLIVQAYDFSPKIEEDDETKAMLQGKNRGFELPATAIPEKFFPPCIQHGLKGLRDGRKRFLFILVNFLSSVGWNHDDMEKFILEWNKRNPEPMRETYIVGHLRYFRQRKQVVPPPNCMNDMYYGFYPQCRMEAFHASIKNPVQWAKKKARLAQRVEEENRPKRRKKKDDEKNKLDESV